MSPPEFITPTASSPSGTALPLPGRHSPSVRFSQQASPASTAGHSDGALLLLWLDVAVSEASPRPLFNALSPPESPPEQRLPLASTWPSAPSAAPEDLPLLDEIHEVLRCLADATTPWCEVRDAVDTLCLLALEDNAVLGRLAPHLPRWTPDVQIAMLDGLMDYHVRINQPDLEAALEQALHHDDRGLFMTAMMALDRCVGWSPDEMAARRSTLSETRHPLLDAWLRRMG